MLVGELVAAQPGSFGQGDGARSLRPIAGLAARLEAGCRTG